MKMFRLLRAMFSPTVSRSVSPKESFTSQHLLAVWKLEVDESGESFSDLLKLQFKNGRFYGGRVDVHSSFGTEASAGDAVERYWVVLFEFEQQMQISFEQVFLFMDMEEESCAGRHAYAPVYVEAPMQRTVGGQLERWLSTCLWLIEVVGGKTQVFGQSTIGRVSHGD